MPCIQRRVEMGKQVNLSMCVSEQAGQLNPDWVETLMGLPIGYTRLDTPSDTGQHQQRKTSSAEGQTANSKDCQNTLDTPAALGQPQHEWEPPRVAKGIPDRVNRLKALGNGGMWQIPYIIGTFIKEVSKCNTHS